jgi:hypothetical protein
MAERPFRLADAPDPVLDQALADLGRDLAFPPTPDLTGRVAATLRAEAAIPVPVRLITHWRRGLVAAAMILLLIGVGLLTFPETRSAIADRLGLPGVEIRWFENEPTPVPAPDVSSLGLGRPVTLEEARAAAPFAVAVPTLSGFADPPQVYLRGAGDTTMVSFVYPASADLPSAEVPGIGALLTQFAGTTNRNFIMKGLSGFDDGPATSVEAITVGGNRGFWIADAPHGVLLVCNEAEDDCREERYRLAGNVLLWEDDGITRRIESGLSREESLATAESMQAVSDP